MSKVRKSPGNRARNARYAARHPVQMLQASPAVASMRDRARGVRDRARDHVSDVPARTRIAANRVHVAASNAWHRAAGNRIHGARIGISNRRNRRAIERGRAPRLTGVNAVVSSRLPVYRNRVNPAHGNRHREDARLHRTGNEGLARMKGRDPRTDPMAEALRSREARCPDHGEPGTPLRIRLGERLEQRAADRTQRRRSRAGRAR